MPRRRLLTDHQRSAFQALPHPQDFRLIARYYTLSDEDHELIARQSYPAYQFSLAIHLCYLRYPGRVWDIDEVPPDYLVNTIGQQLQLPASILAQYDPQSSNRRNQLQLLRQEYGFQRFNDNTQLGLRDWIYSLALSTDRAVVLMTHLIEKLRHDKVIIPALSTLEMFLAPIMDEADTETTQALIGNLTPDQLEWLDLLLQSRDGGHQSFLGWLQQPTGRPSTDSFLNIVDRLTFLQGIDLDLSALQHINANRLNQLARVVKSRSAWRIKQITSPEQRYTMLVAFALQHIGYLIDEALKVFLILYQQIFNRAKNIQKQQFYQEGKSINQHLRQYVSLGKALIQAKDQQQDAFEAITVLMPWQEFVANIAQAENLMRPKNFDYLDLIGKRYSYIRRFSRALIASFSYQGFPETDDLRRAIQLIREVDQGERADLPDWTPIQFVDAVWKPYVFDDLPVKRRFYELCVLDNLRTALRSGDIWVEHSQQFRPLDAYLIPEDSWQTMVDNHTIPISMPLDAVTYLRERHDMLHHELQSVQEGLEAGLFPDVELLDDRLKISRTTLDVPSDMKRVTRAVYDLLPRIRITDLLLEVNASVQFSRHFTHFQSGTTLDDPILLATTILAGAINLGLEKMAFSSHYHAYDRLSWVNDWFMRDETYSKALASLVHVQLNNPFAHHWGRGATTSSDNQNFPVGGTNAMKVHRNPYYGHEPGIGFYTHVTDQHSPFYVQVISTRVHEAPYMLNGLLNHETQLDIQLHATDTKGFSDHIFALCHLLGFRFAPRIRRFGHLRLYPIKSKSTYPTLKPIMGRRINTDLIYENWYPLLRIASSLKLGTVTPPIFVQRLAAYPQQNQWAKALSQVGRLERTLFALRWIQDEALRKQVNTALYKGEARNALARAVCLHRLGRIRDRDYDSQRYRASALNLVVSAIIIWNTVYIEQAVNHLRSQGMEITDQHLEHLTPLGWEHISLTGDYVWNPNLTTNLTNLRDLRV